MEDKQTRVAATAAKQKVIRCLDWLLDQNSQEDKRNKKNSNDIEFIVETNADRKNFMLSSIDDDASVPAGVDDIDVKPVNVPVHKLRIENLRLECQWQSCTMVTNNYELFQKHVTGHTQNVLVITLKDKIEYVCLWDACGFKTDNFEETYRHVTYHAYHAKLLAIGFNARATLNLVRCKRDSTKRNQLPSLKNDYYCLWYECEEKFNCVQHFFSHVKHHVNLSDKIICSWAGCGQTFKHRETFRNHVHTHTGERVIACFHCGTHFATNTKLKDHVLRQTVPDNTDQICVICGAAFASPRLLRDHFQQHVSVHECSLCDMTSPSLGALAIHVRYRHLGHNRELRMHHCPQCDYRAITKPDLNKHILIHNRKKRKKKVTKTKDDESSDDDNILTQNRKKRKKKIAKTKNDESSDDDISLLEVARKKNKAKKKYCCHMCTEKKIFSRGTRLTTHLVKVHGVQRPSGFSKFRYLISDDGMYRVTNTRCENFIVANRKLYTGVQKKTFANTYDVEVYVKSEPTASKPKQYGVKFKEVSEKEEDSEKEEVSDKEEISEKEEVSEKKEISHDDEVIEEQDSKEMIKKEEVESDCPNNEVEITMCDVDDKGNIIYSQIVKSDVQII